MALAGTSAFKLLQAAGLSALSRGGASGWLRGVHSGAEQRQAAQPQPVEAEAPAEPRWTRELGVIRTDWT